MDGLVDGRRSKDQRRRTDGGDPSQTPGDRPPPRPESRVLSRSTYTQSRGLPSLGDCVLVYGMCPIQTSWVRVPCLDLCRLWSVAELSLRKDRPAPSVPSGSLLLVLRCL